MRVRTDIIGGRPVYIVSGLGELEHHRGLAGLAETVDLFDLVDIPAPSGGGGNGGGFVGQIAGALGIPGAVASAGVGLIGGLIGAISDAVKAGKKSAQWASIRATIKATMISLRGQGKAALDKAREAGSAAPEIAVVQLKKAMTRSAAIFTLASQKTTLSLSGASAVVRWQTWAQDLRDEAQIIAAHLKGENIIPADAQSAAAIDQLAQAGGVTSSTSAARGGVEIDMWTTVLIVLGGLALWRFTSRRK